MNMLRALNDYADSFRETRVSRAINLGNPESPPEIVDEPYNDPDEQHGDDE